MKLLFYDLETTGTKYWQNGIHQISGCIEIDGTVTEHFNFHVQPHEKAIIDPPALLVTKVTEEDLKGYEPMERVYFKFQAMLCKYVDRYNPKDKFFLVGYNSSSFDDDFLRMWFKLNHSEFFGSFFWPGSIDVMVLAAYKLMPIRHEMASFKMHRVAKQLGLKVDDSKLHDAKYDTELLRQIYYTVTTNIDDIL